MKPPVTIIGAGLAGLYAGLLLKQRGIEFLILEASARTGGRILSKPHASAVSQQLAVDLGPSWFWPHQTGMLELMQTLKVPYFRQYVNGDALFQADSQTPIERFLPSYMESFRVTGGMITLVEQLVELLPHDSIKYGHQVCQISQHGSTWCIETQDDKLGVLTDKLIIATPPRVIVGKLQMENKNLAPLIDELAKVPTWMAAQAKFVATYDRAFWREQGLSGQAFSRQGPMVEIHDSSAAENDGFALFGFIGVPASHRQQIPHEELRQACLMQLVKIFGEPAQSAEETYLTDWATNDLVASPADLNEQPNHPQVDLNSYRQALIDSGLYFAASEVARRDAGYLQGAIIAATDAVEAITENLTNSKTNNA